MVIHPTSTQTVLHPHDPNANLPNPTAAPKTTSEILLPHQTLSTHHIPPQATRPAPSQVYATQRTQPNPKPLLCPRHATLHQLGEILCRLRWL